ncbi:hypothetical protein NLM33_39760 [Bradyrhizobium sp. CCGUVB1N3]|uniref:hypothetical protein n=1 Tax=Bradyrhizobium sp. CCGUVB1N3 TaxID=2949629 RepID=UPI0020B3D88F|nr:hypothetical protein [Bradyrhizobium sp. CCGUVB1N3]MCP3476358.1 hypothetical protein [Bradyrhizobium sp. CCGUVB1N3]
MAGVNDFCKYIEELEQRVRALEKSGSGQQRRVACGEGKLDPNAAGVRIDLGFRPSQVAVYGATFNPNMSEGSTIYIQGPEGPKFIYVAVE